jgi:hypothetical protein
MDPVGMPAIRKKWLGLSWIPVVVALLSPPLSTGQSSAAAVELTVVDYPKQVRARSSFFVRIRITNHGKIVVRPCDTSPNNSIATEACVAVVYRKGKRPPQFSFSRVEVSPVLRPTAKIEPGGVFETAVELPTPDRKGEYVVYLYSVTGEAGPFVWNEFPLTVDVGDPPGDVARRLLVSRAFLAIYLVGTVAMISWVFMRSRTATRA